MIALAGWQSIDQLDLPIGVFLTVLVPKLRVTAREIHWPAVDPRLFDLGSELQRVARSNDERGGFAGLEASEPVADSEDLGGVDRNGAEALVGRQSIGDCRCGVVGEIAKMCGKFHAVEGPDHLLEILKGY